MSRFHIDPNERVDIAEFDPDELISDASPNVITIRARMSVDIAGRVSSELAKMGADNKAEIRLGEHTTALLLHNILGWRGPDFDDLPCTPENIRALPSANSDPFIEKVLNAIGERNKKRESPNARAAAIVPTSASAGETDFVMGAPAERAGAHPRSENGILRSDSRSAFIGRRSKSDA
jgi:hypothetical protein